MMYNPFFPPVKVGFMVAVGLETACPHVYTVLMMWTEVLNPVFLDILYESLHS